jgi:hypothetical protein
MHWAECEVQDHSVPCLNWMIMLSGICALPRGGLPACHSWRIAWRVEALRLRWPALAGSCWGLGGLVNRWALPQLLDQQLRTLGGGTYVWGGGRGLADC